MYVKAADEKAAQRGKRIACTGNEEHHFLDTVRRTLFSEVTSSHVTFRASPKGLH